MTKANDRARAAVADAERRARRKIKRLQGKGVRTGNITPFREVDASDTWALKRYANDLERFVSRQTRYVAGYDGTPIPYETYRDFRRLEKKYNAAHAKWWDTYGNQPFITAEGASETTIAERSLAARLKGMAFGGASAYRETPVEKLRGVKDIEKRSAIMRRELSPTYQKERTRTLRRNLLAHASEFNDPRIPKMIRKLSNEQLFALQNFTNFVPLYYRYMSTNVEVTLGTDIDAMEHDAQVRHMIDTIEQVRLQFPASVKTRETKGRKTKSGRVGKKSKAKIKVYAPTKADAKEKAHAMYQDIYGG
jgi:hypothetical protein